jgi:CBS domain-containing protein
MHTTTHPLLSRTAGEMMARQTVHIPERMSMRDAARLLLQNQISGGPVVDDRGRCVGVLATTDFMPLARNRPVSGPTPVELPITCSFQRTAELADGTEVIGCTLPAGVCPLQIAREGRGGKGILVCREPRCVLCDWQVVAIEKLPDDEVRRYMTADPVTATPETLIQTLARQMIDAHIHRIIVVDEQQRPIGIITSTDILAAVAYAGDGP